MNQISKRNRIAVFLLAAAVGLIVLGAVRGEVGVVFNKAVNICLECVGLG